MPKYVITYGEDDPLELPADLNMAQTCMMGIINDMNLPGWRKKALIVQAQNMPVAGFSFTDQAGTLLKIEKVK